MKSLPDFGLFLSLILLSIFLLILDSFGFLKYPKIGLSFLTSPIQYGFYKTSQNIQNQFIFIKNTKELARQNEELKKELTGLLSENMSLKQQLMEVNAVNSQTQYLDPKNYNMLPARPIGLNRFLHIDKGSEDGIKNGQVVIFENNFIGKIHSVSPKGASLTLITDPDIKLSAFSQNLEGRAKGVISGQFSSEILFGKILQEEKIKVGDLVYTDGLEEFIPRGLIVGKVSEVLGKTSDVFKKAKLKPVIDIRSLQVLFVILD